MKFSTLLTVLWLAFSTQSFASSKDVYSVPITITFTDTLSKNGKAGFTKVDPCSCSDPLNVFSSSGEVELFHDILTITKTPVGTDYDVEIFSIVYAPYDNKLLDVNGDPIAVGTIIGRIQSGLMQFDYYHKPNMPSTVPLIINGGVSTFTTSNCSATVCNPNPVPTMSQWTLIILGFSLTIFGIVAITQKSFQST